jgi:3-dehydroquinate dehydratase-2
MMTTIHVLNGPNLNLLGSREPETYGTQTLADIEAKLAAICKGHGVGLQFRQSNHEGDLVTWIQEAGKAGDPIIINAGAYSHTSIALIDAIKGTNAKVTEVHLSNIHAREAYRHHSYVSGAARGIIMGFGALGYELAITAIMSDISAASRS